MAGYSTPAIAVAATSPWVSGIERSFAARAVARTNDLPPSGKTIGTHSGNFQADEALGCWFLRQLPAFAGAKVVRTRDEALLKECDIVIDVGGIYDYSRMRFDHHQRGFFETVDGEPGKATKAEEATGHFKTKLSASGLVYKHWGREIISGLAGTSATETEAVWNELYVSWLEAIDATDNGIEVCEGAPLYKEGSNLSCRVGGLNPRWNEESDHEDQCARFEKASALCGAEFLEVLGELVEAWLPARALVEDALNRRTESHVSGQVLQIKSGAMPWKEHLYALEKEQGIAGLVKFVLFTDQSGMWRIQAVTVEGTAFTNRLSLLEPWCGLRNEALSQKSGIPDCCFVHATGFIGGNKTYEGALAMAVKTLEAKAATTMPRFQQTMVRIKDPKISVPFYQTNFAMKLVHWIDFPQWKFTVYFLERQRDGQTSPECTLEKTSVDCEKYLNNLTGTTIELTHNHGTESDADFKGYWNGNTGRDADGALKADEPAYRGFGHIAFNVDDVDDACDRLEKNGVKFHKKPNEGRMKGLAFCLDPDGYWIEIVRRQNLGWPEYHNLSQTMMRVKDGPKTVEFYTKHLGMTLLRQMDMPQYKFTNFFLASLTPEELKAGLDALPDEEKEVFKDGFDPTKPNSLTKVLWNTCLELTWNHGTENDAEMQVHNGNSAPQGFGHIGFLVDDLPGFCGKLEAEGVTFKKKPEDGNMRGIAFAYDPNGYWIELIDRKATFAGVAANY